MYRHLDDDQYSEHDEMDFSDPQDCNFNSDCFEDWSGERNDYDSDYDYQYLTFQEDSCEDEFQDQHACDDFCDDFDCHYDGHDDCSAHDGDQDWIDYDTYHTQDEYYDIQNEYYDSQCEQDSNDPCQHHYMRQPQHRLFEFDHDRFQPGSSDNEDREAARCDQASNFQQPPQGQDAEQSQAVPVPSSAPLVCTVFARPTMPPRPPSQHQPRMHLDHQRHQYSTRASNFPGTLSFGPTAFSHNARTDRRPERSNRQQRRQHGRERLREDPRQVRARQVSQQLHTHRQHQEQQQRDRRLAQKEQERQQEEDRRARQEHHLQQQLRLVQEQMLEQQRRQAQIEDQRASVAHRQAKEQQAAHYIAQMHAHAAYMSTTYMHQQAFFAPVFPLGFSPMPMPMNVPMPALIPIHAAPYAPLPASVPARLTEVVTTTQLPLEPPCAPALPVIEDASETISKGACQDKLCMHELCIPDNIDNLDDMCTDEVVSTDSALLCTASDVCPLVYVYAPIVPLSNAVYHCDLMLILYLNLVSSIESLLYTVAVLMYQYSYNVVFLHRSGIG